LEYIQCPQCEKKYTVNDKLKAATGKHIRCKHCQQAFEIVIHDGNNSEPQDIASPVSIAESTVEASTPSSSNSPLTEPLKIDDQPEDTRPSNVEEQDKERNEEQTQPAKKKNVKLQFLISIILGLILICASLGTYLFFYNPELLNKTGLFNTTEQQQSTPIIPHNLVNPMTIHLSHPAQSKKTASPPAKQISPQHTASVPAESNQPSQVCKDASADYWLRTHLLATAKLDTNTYIKLLDMNVKQAVEIRKLCKETTVISRISEAARKGKKPPWIRVEIDSHLAAQFNAVPASHL